MFRLISANIAGLSPIGNKNSIFACIRAILFNLEIVLSGILNETHARERFEAMKVNPVQAILASVAILATAVWQRYLRLAN